MGYYTYYTLEVAFEEGDESGITQEEIISQLRSEYEEAADAIDDSGKTAGEGRWYDCLENLKEFSKGHPSAYFKLIQRPAQGTPSERAEVWINYFQNGDQIFDDEYPTCEEVIEAKVPGKSAWEIWMEKSRAARNKG